MKSFFSKIKLCFSSSVSSEEEEKKGIFVSELPDEIVLSEEEEEEKGIVVSELPDEIVSSSEGMVVSVLPDEIVEEILSRVPAKYVIRCKSVCRRWKAIASTEQFAWLHHHHSSSSSYHSTVLVEELSCPIRSRDVWNFCEDYYKVGKKRYITMSDAWREGRGNNKSISTLEASGSGGYYEVEDESTMHLCFSCSGLMVLFPKIFYDLPFSSQFVIFNPITRDKVKITVADVDLTRERRSIRGQIYGVFFHPQLKEFCLLWGREQLLPRFNPTYDSIDLVNRSLEEFRLLNLGPSQPRWKSINNQSTHRLLKQHQQPRNLARTDGCRGAASPVVLDHVLYWMVDEEIAYRYPNPRGCEEAILAFDTIQEEFHLLPHPGPCPCPCSPENLLEFSENLEQLYNHRTMHLLENDKNLSVFQSSYTSNREWLFSIWNFNFKREEDATNHININKGEWMKVHTVKLDHVDRSVDLIYSTEIHKGFFVPTFNLKPVALVNGELLVLQWEILGRVYVFNLRSGTHREFVTTRDPNSKNYFLPLSGPYGTFMCAHRHTFIPIRNSHPEILIT